MEVVSVNERSMDLSQTRKNQRKKKNMKTFKTLGGTAAILLSLVSSPLRADTTPAANDIVVVAASAGSFKTLVAAVKAADLVGTLQGTGPFTVFAPTDEAFAKLPPGTVEMLLKPENKEKLVAVLTYHVVPGKVMAVDVKTGTVKTVNGQSLNVQASEGKVSVDGATVVTADVLASNGVIHVIDTVILPKNLGKLSD